MSKKRIIHLASHTGNIGDNASHIGLRKILSEVLEDDYSIDRLEIRKAYNIYSRSDKINFDEKFAEKVNEYDLLIIGGGGFLDFWVENSVTGTTLDIKEEIINKIKTPTLIASVGSIPHKEVPKGNVEKFRDFIELLLGKDNIRLAVRNDGSKKIIKDYIGEKFSKQIPEILDNGFFYGIDEDRFDIFDKNFVVINTTVDQLNMKNRRLGEIDSEVYHDELTKVVEYLLSNTNYEIVFVSHIYRDLKSINSVLERLDDFDIRTRISVAPYLHGDDGCNKLFSLYDNSDLILGMRFHSNICSLAMNKLSIGLAALDRVVNMYEGLNLRERYVRVDYEYSSTAIKRIESCLSNKDKLLKKSKSQVDEKKKETLGEYGKIFEDLRFKTER